MFIDVSGGGIKTSKIGNTVEEPFTVLEQNKHTVLLQRIELVERLTADGFYSPLWKLACLHFLSSQVQQRIFSTRICKGHPGCFIESRTIISQMMVNLKFY